MTHQTSALIAQIYRLVSRLATSCLVFAMVAASAAPAVQANQPVSVYSAAELAAAVAADLGDARVSMLDTRGRLAIRGATLRVGGESGVPCRSATAVKIEAQLREKLSPLFEMPARDDAAAIAREVEWTQELAERFSVSKLAVFEFLPDAGVQVRLVDAGRAENLYLRNFVLRGDIAEGLENIAECDCEFLCADAIPFPVIEGWDARLSAMPRCRYDGAWDDLFLLPSCRSALNATPMRSNPYAIDRVQRECERCGGALPTVRQLEMLRVCGATPDATYACLEAGVPRACELTETGVRVRLLKSTTRFSEHYCQLDVQ
jgi:hypothetical protein